MIKIGEIIKITDFGKRHFDPKFSGTKITNKTPEDFEDYLNLRMTDALTPNNGNQTFRVNVIDGYAPFCKLIVIENFTNARVGSMPITMANYQYIRHGYSSRTPVELEVMSRWFELPLPAPVADYLVVVVYSREQLEKEHNESEQKAEKEYKIQFPNVNYAPKHFEFRDEKDVEWGVVAILGQTHPNEEPMQPITMMRNALGTSEGGSGVPIDRQKYAASVEFWKNNAVVKS